MAVLSSGCLAGSEAVASRAVAVVLLSLGVEVDADEAAVHGEAAHEAEAGERFPVMRLRGPGLAARAAALEERLMGPETGPRRDTALWGSGPEGAK